MPAPLPEPRNVHCLRTGSSSALLGVEGGEPRPARLRPRWPSARRGSGVAGRGRGTEFRGAHGAVDDALRNTDEAEVVAAGVCAQGPEGLVHAETGSLSGHSLGLLDQHAAVERLLQLFVYDLAFEPGAVLQGRLVFQNDSKSDKVVQFKPAAAD